MEIRNPVFNLRQNALPGWCDDMEEGNRMITGFNQKKGGLKLLKIQEIISALVSFDNGVGLDRWTSISEVREVVKNDH